jgi:sterol desaturase/sphingolipid hydroxylase (fatty acid hydroxylase superfamily)
MRSLVSRHLLAASILLGAGSFLLALVANVSLDLAVTASTVATLLLAMLLERLMPFRREWNNKRGDTGTDVASAIVLVGVVDPLLKYIAPILVIWAYAQWSEHPSAGIGSSWNLGIQFVAVLLLAEFGRYWAHRAHHSLRPLWWLHAMHHSSERLYAVNNMRFHPLNYAINFAAGVLPAMFLGFSPEALFAYMAVTQPILMLQHANIDLRSGWLNYVVSSNEVHRWHHSTGSSEANANFGNALLLWDHLFGTFRAPGFPAEQQVGLFSESSSYPSRAGYFAQLKSMFLPSCCAA